MADTAPLDRLERASRFSAILMAMGALVIFAALGLTYAQHRTMQAEIGLREQEVARASSTMFRLQEYSEKLRGYIERQRAGLTELRAAVVAFHRREYDTALSRYDETLRTNPDNAYVLNLKAYSLFTLNRVDEAVEVQKKGVEVDDEYAWGFFDLARFQCAAGDFRRARGSIARARNEGLDSWMQSDEEFQKLCGPILN
jgi:tetratricopeptide (TPR) repeat protein